MHPPSQSLQKAGAIFVLLTSIVLSVAAVRTMRSDIAFASAQQQIATASGDGIAALQTAVRMRPDSATPYRMLAEQTAFSDPHKALLAAQTAVALAGTDWRNWKTLGLIQFQLNEPGPAWNSFLKGLADDAGFQGHYQFANFAYVLGKETYFWSELKSALAVAPSDQIPIILGSAIARSGANPSKIISMLPVNSPENLVDSLDYLNERHQVETAAEGWSKLPSCPLYLEPRCGATAAGIANALMLASYTTNTPSAEIHVRQAVSIWNDAVKRGWLRQSMATSGASNDGDFRFGWQGPAFSWTTIAGLSHQFLPAQLSQSGNQVLFQFNGREPENLRLFHQFVATQPGASYQLTCTTRKIGTGTQTGIVIEVITSKATIVTASLPLTTQWSTTQLTFTTGASDHVVNLQVLYRRPEGETLLYDTVAFQRVELRPINNQDQSEKRPN